VRGQMIRLYINGDAVTNAPNLQTTVTEPMNSYRPDHLGSLPPVIPLSSAHLPPPSHSLPKLADSQLPAGWD